MISLSGSLAMNGSVSPSAEKAKALNVQSGLSWNAASCACMNVATVCASAAIAASVMKGSSPVSTIASRVRAIRVASRSESLCIAISWMSSDSMSQNRCRSR